MIAIAGVAIIYGVFKKSYVVKPHGKGLKFSCANVENALRKFIPVIRIYLAIWLSRLKEMTPKDYIQWKFKINLNLKQFLANRTHIVR